MMTFITKLLTGLVFFILSMFMTLLILTTSSAYMLGHVVFILLVSYFIGHLILEGDRK